MKTFNIGFGVAATTAKTAYYPVIVRGNIAAIKGVYNKETDADEVVTIARGSDTVFTITPPADATAAGTVIDGVAHATNGGLIFDPDSDTVTDKVIKVSVPNTFDTAGALRLTVSYDNSAYVAQAASEA